jgi:hypothetical protein
MNNRNETTKMNPATKEKGASVGAPARNLVESIAENILPRPFAELALPILARGIAVVPVDPGAKRCLLPKWHEQATTDTGQIDVWATIFPNHNVGCVAKNDGVCIIDCDIPGIPEFIENATGQKLPRTYTVRSAGRGLPHLYFKHTDKSRALGNRALPGKLDFKAHNSYVVGPGSVLETPAGPRTYDVIDNGEIVPMPDWLADWIGAVTAAQKSAGKGPEVSSNFDIDEFLTHYELDYDVDGDYYITDVCPVAGHKHQQSTKTGFYFDGKRLGFECFASGCAGSNMNIGEVIRHLNKARDGVVRAPYAGEIWAKDAPLTLSDALEQFNREYCYVNEGHAVVQVASRMVMRATDFKGAHAANRFALKSTTNVEDGTTRAAKVQIAKAWLEWPKRHQVERMVYEPGKPKFFENQLNRWRGWGCPAVQGDTTPWEQLLDNLFRGDTGARHWFEQWCAYPIQNPGAKLAHAVILFGVRQGTGKTTVGETLGRIYGSNFSVIREEQLHAAFNDWAADKQFILADEITGGGDKRVHADRLKLMVTGSTVHVNKKFEPEYTLRDSINYLFTSNHCNSFYLEDSDRRYFVWEVNGPALNGEFFCQYYRWLENGGPSALFHRLQHLDLSGFQPYQAPPKTSAKQEMIELGWSELDRWIRQQVANPAALVKEGGHVWTSAELLTKYHAGRALSNQVKQAGMTAGLKKAGLVSRRVQVREVGFDNYCFPLTPDWNERPTRDWAAEYVTHHTPKPDADLGI